MSNKTIILSIRPTYAEKIFAGLKLAELRRTRPLYLTGGGIGLIYVSSPVCSLAGAFRVAEVVQVPLMQLWKMVRYTAGLTYGEFIEYYSDVSIGTCIFFSKVWRFRDPISLDNLRGANFIPPQTFRYATSSELTSPSIAGLLADIGIRVND